MQARFCDIYYLINKTMNPATLKQLDYHVDQDKMDASEHYTKVFLFSDLFDISNPAPDITCSILANSGSSTTNIIGMTTIYNDYVKLAEEGGSATCNGVVRYGHADTSTWSAD